jgi:cytochrome c1
MASDKHCFRCHEDIAAGRFGMGSPKLGRWRATTAAYRHVPSLEAAGRRFKRDWIQRFLLAPYDLRPHLTSTMPRLALTPADAADLAAFITRDGEVPPPTRPQGTPNMEKGRALLETKGCGGCHEMTGAPALPTRPDPSQGDDQQKKGIELAPDLRHTRDRFREVALVDWLVAPKSMKRDTVMPSHGLTSAEAGDIAAYLMQAPLDPAPPTDDAPRLPLLARPVTFKEVDARVLSVTCRHCHTNPDSAGGDGGPGNTGGFGFRPRGIDLSTYGGVAAGHLDLAGERRSLFTPTHDDTPLLVSALLARREEEAGRIVPGIRGMPIGLPSISALDLQLVETWIAQGRPR